MDIFSFFMADVLFFSHLQLVEYRLVFMISIMLVLKECSKNIQKHIILPHLEHWGLLQKSVCRHNTVQGTVHLYRYQDSRILR